LDSYNVQKISYFSYALRNISKYYHYGKKQLLNSELVELKLQHEQDGR